MLGDQAVRATFAEDRHDGFEVTLLIHSDIFGAVARVELNVGCGADAIDNSADFLARHVLDDAEDGDVDLLKHADRLADVKGRNGLRRGNQN